MPLTHYWSFKDNPAEIIFWGRSNIERVIPLFFYINNYKNLIHQLKYKNNIYIGEYLGYMLGEKIKGCLNTDNIIIIPTPLHLFRQIRRGYNQSNIIAKGVKKYLAKETNIRCTINNKLIYRNLYTKTQTQKDKIDRWNNVKDAFKINCKEVKNVTPNSTIILIDDVLTTGATLDACATLIKQNLECKIYIATLAYVE